MRKMMLGAFALILVFMSSCGGGTTTTTTVVEEVIPVAADPAIVATVNAFTANASGNLVDLVVTANGQTIDDNSRVELDAVHPILQLSAKLYGLGVVDPQTKQRIPRLDISDLEVDGQNLCEFGVSYANVGGVVLNPSNISETLYGIDFTPYQKSDEAVTIWVSVTGKADPGLALVWTAKILGLLPMPSTNATTITTTTVVEESGGNDWMLAGVVGLAIGLLSGNPAAVVGTGVRIACGDPYENEMFPVVIPASGQPTPTTDLTISGPSQARAGDINTIDITSNCPGGWTVEWTGGGRKTGQGNDSFTMTMPNSQLVLVATDECGNSDTLTVLLTLPTANLPPVADLVANPTNGVESLNVTLNASGSSDPDGNIVSYEWDFEGNGSYDSTTTSAMTTHVYLVGTWSPKVRVTDNDGATDVATVTTAIVVSAPSNLPPNADLVANPTNGVESLNVTLNASGSSDPDGNIVSYEWDFEGNGSYDSTTTSAMTTHVYLVGTWSPKVRVTDNDGATDVATVTTAIVVSAGQNPWAGVQPFITPRDIGLNGSEPLRKSSGDEANLHFVLLNGDGEFVTPPSDMVASWTVSSGSGTWDWDPSTSQDAWDIVLFSIFINAGTTLDVSVSVTGANGQLSGNDSTQARVEN